MNKVFIIGNLVADPELRKTQSGLSVCSFRVAVSRDHKNKDGVREADFFTVITWRALADLCAKALAKGRKIGVCGSLQTRSYEQNGAKRFVTEIIAQDVEFLTPRGDAAAQAGAESISDVTAGPEAFEQVDDDELPF